MTDRQLARWPAAAPASAPRGDGCRNRDRRLADGGHRFVPVGLDGRHDRPRDRARAARLAGRGTKRERTRPGYAQAVKRFPGVRSALLVDYAHSSGYSATTGGVARAAGAGLVLGIPPGYRRTYPGEIRQFIGARNGVLVAQQMAANLGVTVGDTFTLDRAPLAPARLRVDGIIDFAAPQQLLGPVGLASPYSPSARQRRGAARTRAGTSSSTRWRANGPRSCDTRCTPGSHTPVCPRDPTSAFAAAEGIAKNLETRLAGTGVVGNNLATALDRRAATASMPASRFSSSVYPARSLAALLTHHDRRCRSGQPAPRAGAPPSSRRDRREPHPPRSRRGDRSSACSGELAGLLAALAIGHARVRLADASAPAARSAVAWSSRRSRGRARSRSRGHRPSRVARCSPTHGAERSR